MRRRVRKHNVQPLVHEIQRTVRFEETDAMGVVWHGRYASWLEDGREALNAAYGISYLRFVDAGVLVPLRIFHMDYLHPLMYPHTYTIRTALLWSDAARIDYAYTLFDENGTIIAEANTTQLMTSLKGELLLESPEFFLSFREQWRNGALQ